MVRGDTIEQARNLAAERGVSERTVWRWFAAMRAADSLELLERERICECCERDLPAHSTIRRRYCDGTCRVNAHRARRTGRSRPRGRVGSPHRRPRSCAAARHRLRVRLDRGGVLLVDHLAPAEQGRGRDARAGAEAAAPMTAGHFIFIPSVMLIGVIIGWVLGSRAARDAFAHELKRREERAQKLRSEK